MNTTRLVTFFNYVALALVVGAPALGLSQTFAAGCIGSMIGAGTIGVAVLILPNIQKPDEK